MEDGIGIKVEHDGVVGIAVGRSRMERVWQNVSIKWSELLERLGKTTYTNESFDEYRKLSKLQQDDIKDVGGFVGGTLRGGRRKNDSIESRSLVTLDADFAALGIFDSIKTRFEFSFCIYSTHKHSPQKPRFRIVIPLLRPVDPDEYQAVSRKLASDIGMEMFDDTTHEPARLMYWPSASRDGVYEFDYRDGLWLDPDEILKGYEDWRDTRYWPEPDKSIKEKKHGDRKESPGDKNGVVGAFCRTYSIYEAIDKFLKDVYIPCEDKNRYTYKKGSTVGGLVVYDDGNFAYSHHGTDPAGGRLLNAFDLVRLHKFNELDAAAQDGTPVVKLPSYEAMLDLCRNDEEVKMTLGGERLMSAASDFKAFEEGNKEWLRLLEVDKKGNCKATINNVVLILENDPNLKGKVALNEFSHQIVKRDSLPWCKLEKPEGDFWLDSDDASLRHYLERVYNISAAGRINDGVLIIQAKNKYHPVREYLESICWDGKCRAESLFIDYLGADDSVYTRAVTRKMLAAAVARVFEPGIKFDYMLVLVGGQGIGKSEIIRRLGRRWYSDSIITIQGKEAFEQLQGVWIMEMAELSALRRSDVEHVKQYISKCEDKYRMAYERRVAEFPRQCIFFGTTNENEFLRDKTGNRRFWPVITGLRKVREEMWKELTQDKIDQIWAEAFEIWKKGEELYLKGDIEREAERRQELHTESTLSEGLIREYLEMLLPEDWPRMSLMERRLYIHGGDFGEKKEGKFKRTRACVFEVWSELMKGEAKEELKHMTREISEILGRMEGWKHYSNGTGKLRFGSYGTHRAYVRIGTADDPDVTDC